MCLKRQTVDLVCLKVLKSAKTRSNVLKRAKTR